ncbi:hypothetical protein DUNSADRAFT_12754 [Dunaliella salina]|uniref:Guanylate cyclase domain-containing protein n=1 Tax=Dunaliella salina TaxID=3046 RepID=A0ABQ7GAP0_DUNSA|nr:hypothetical protein DUNSADRAFT_12754 [Dunaliella salina]|eukprot:KAF5831673.1 hypothetical protein DUNSADRAFT_12754 [Dunaliella salina]
MEMLAIMLGMYWGSTDAQHLKHLAIAQHRAYRQTLVQTIRRITNFIELFANSICQTPELGNPGEEKIKTSQSGKHSAAQTAAAAATAFVSLDPGLTNGNTGEKPATSLNGSIALRRRRSEQQLAKQQQQLQPVLPTVKPQAGAAAAAAAGGGAATACERPQPRARPSFLPGGRDQQNGDRVMSWESNASMAMPSATELVSEAGTMSTQSGSLDQSQRRFEDHLSCSEKHKSVTVLFSDIVGFTSLSEQLQPTQVMAMLADLYSKFDDMADELQVYTIDTIGDCYMCAANLIQPLSNHAVVMAELGQRMIQVANSTTTPLGTPLVIRVGIHTGPLMSGILGSHRMKFTLVGDTVNVASRMESTALPNTIQVSSKTYELLHLPGIVPWQAESRCCEPPPRHRLATPSNSLPRESSTSHPHSSKECLSGFSPEDEGIQSLDSPQSKASEQFGRSWLSRHPGAKGGEGTRSAASAPSNLVGGQQGGQSSMSNSTEGTVGIASSREGAQQTNDGRRRRPPIKKSSSGTQKAAAVLFEQAVHRRMRTAGKAVGSNSLGPSRTGIGALPLASVSGVEDASSWRARDLMVKGKGCMRTFYLSVGQQTEDTQTRRSIEALTLSDD